MSNLICQYCQKEYSSKSNLLKHQSTTKKCLDLQKSLKIVSKIQNFICQYCNKNFSSKYSLNNHENVCKSKKEHIIDNYVKNNDTVLSEIEFLRNEIKNLQNFKIKYEEILLENQKLREEVASLNGANQVYSEITKNNHQITINNNNKTNNNYSKNITFNSSLNLNDIDTISDIINNKYSIDHLLQGQKGIAHFILENFLKDDDGNLKYICSDPSRKVFNYQTEEGVIEKDLSANKLTNGIVAGGIKEKTINLASTWYTKPDDSIDHDKFRIAVKKQESILEIDQDNNSFKNELAVMTTK
jgi:hypothetical protein